MEQYRQIVVTLNDHEMHPTQLSFFDAEFDIDEVAVAVTTRDVIDIFPTSLVRRIRILQG